MRIPREPRLTLLAVLCAAAASAQVPGSSAVHGDHGTTLESVRVVTDSGSTSVVIVGNGPLPRPTSAPLSNPPRIYFDLTDVSPGRLASADTTNGIVRRIRVAEYTPAPLVTRIVLDLVNTVPYHVNVTAREQGRLVVMLGTPESGRPAGGAIASAPAPTVAAPAAALPRPPANGRANAALESYGIRAASALLRLYALRPVLAAIDKRTETVPGDLTAAAAEFDSIAKLLSGIKPPPGRESAHALLTRACTFGARAVRMRQDSARASDPGWNAASAAAGALLMLDRANDDLASDRNDKK